ncbi:MAG: tRNA (N6-threonylcarbamoyladenosine(37)-N6)-methyltransferase TrmO [Hyphomicrobiaceae bacterium]
MSDPADPYGIRDGERAVPFDPATSANDAGLVFIGRIRSPWRERRDCPKNLRQAREQGRSATVEIDPTWRDGLTGLDRASHLILLYWLDRSRRDLVIQRPRHATQSFGVFSLRSPVRPNPIGLGVVRLLHLDQPAGRLTIDAIDCLDGTPLIDVKPYYASTDAIPEATNG